MALTEEEMVELLRQVYERFNAREFDTLMQIADPGITMARTGALPELTGPEALRAWLEPDAFESQVVEPTEFRVAGNRVLVHVEGTMRGAGSGIEIAVDAWSLWTFGKDGKVTRVENFLPHEEAAAVSALEGG